MLNKSSNKSFCTLLVFTGLFLLLPLTAMGKIIAMDDATEADSISVRINAGTQTSVATVTGCKTCPLELSIDANTRFFRNNEAVEGRRIRSLSGSSGTVIYNSEQQRAIKILW